MALKAWLVACFAFLYAPILFLVVFSFNDARLVTQWAGFSLRWYGVLWRDAAMIDAALLSLRIAALSATLSCILGAAGGLVMARFGPFRGRALFAAGLG